MDCWMAADLVLLITFNPDETSHPFAISIFIGAVAYFFADWMEDATTWAINKVCGKDDNK